MTSPIHNLALIQGRLDEEAIPGTVHLIDREGTMQAKHAKGGLSDVVLVPAPSDDPDDPLNWSPVRKMASTVSMCVYILVTALASAAIYGAIVPIAKETGLSVDQLNTGTGYMFLAFGWGCLFWQPMALQYGKRPVYLICLLASLPIMVAQAHAKSNTAWIICKVLQGFFGAPVECLAGISVADVYFSHQRGRYIAIFICALNGAGFLGPTLGGFINDGQGWQWIQYWLAIWFGIGFIFCFFFMEETNYDRAPLAVIEQPNSASPTLAPPTLTPNTLTPDELVEAEKPVDAEILCVEKVPSRPVISRKPKSFVQRMSLIDKKRPFTVHTKMARILKLLSFPIIIFAGFQHGCSLCWYNVMNATASLVLSSPPYNFTAAKVGCTYFATTIGVVLAFPYAGIFGDWVVLQLARRNGGIWESEQRLWLFLLPLVVLPLSLVLWGVGAYYEIAIFGLVFAEFLTGLTITVAVQLTICYCIDSYKELDAEAIASIILIRCTMSFAVGYGVTPWITNLGLQKAYIIAAFVGLGTVLTVFPIIKFGPKLRAKSRAQYFKLVKEALAENNTT